MWLNQKLGKPLDPSTLIVSVKWAQAKAQQQNPAGKGKPKLKLDTTSGQGFTFAFGSSDDRDTAVKLIQCELVRPKPATVGDISDQLADTTIFNGGEGAGAEVASPDGIIDLVYNRLFDSETLSLDAAHESTEADARLVNNASGGGHAINYGEFDPKSWSEVLPQLHLSESDVFYDLGSGRGCLAFQTALQIRCKKSVGVELSHERHVMALKGLSNLRQTGVQTDTKLEFRHEDIRHTDVKDATVIYLMNQDMPRKLNEYMWTHQISQIEHPVCVLTLVRFRMSEGETPQPAETLVCRQTWSGGQDVRLHVYRFPGKAPADPAKPGVRFQ